jgi:hypothetical protein
MNALDSYLFNVGTKYARICDVCGCGMINGFIVADTETICSESCLQKANYPLPPDDPEDWDLEDTYWTQWEDEDDYEYIVSKDGNLIDLI